MKILKFSSETCMPCRNLAKTIEQLEPDTQALFEEYKSEKDITKFMQFNVRSVPTMIIVDESGNELRRHTGIMQKDQLLEFIAL